MLCGIVGVETIGNDFDFQRDRFSSEFLWHNSVEATEYQRTHGQADEPVCWMQTGYASGYASKFFKRLVIFEEVECMAMGHKACRLKGGTADKWGENSDIVRFFRDRVVSPLQVPKAARTVGKSRGSPQLTYVHCARPDMREALAELLAPKRKPAADRFRLLDGVDALPGHLQSELAFRLDDTAQRGPCFAAIIEAQALPLLDQRLRFACAALSMPPLTRRSDITQLAEMVLKDLAETHVVPVPSLSEAARQSLHDHAWPGNLHELRGRLRDALMACDGRDIETLDLGQDGLHGTYRSALQDALDQGPIDIDGLVDEVRLSAWEKADHNVSVAARLLKLTRPQLSYRLKRASTKSPG
ncbi:MAG: V4R domain-containing protein [Pseudomonadota bacterium]